MTPSGHEVSASLHLQRATLSAHIVAREFERQPELARRYGPAGREKCLQDAGYHLGYLSQAIAVEEPALFAHYLAWAKVMLAKRGVPSTDLACLLETMRVSLADQLAPEVSELAVAFVEHGLRALPDFPEEAPSLLRADAPLSGLATAYLGTLLRGDRSAASRLILAAAAEGTPVRDLYLHVFERTQHEIGRLWQVNEISVAQEHFCTAATQLVISQLYPYILAGGKTRGTLVSTGVAGDLHEMGARMVSDFFELEGWSTYYLGANVPAAHVVQAVVERRASVLAISATIAYHVDAVAALIAAIRRHPACGAVKILVGGYPFKIAADLWRRIGADGSAADARSAVALASRLVLT